MHAHVGVGGRAGKRGCAVAVVGERQPVGQRRRGERQRVAVVQVGIAGSDGIGVGSALRGGGNRRAGEVRGVIDVGHRDGEGLRIHQPTIVGHALHHRVLAYL
ncbi:MAG: hypothetical protein RBT75_16995, partial [Anaerolineae bacterium]|nr:hypothetical protein [Anaerolineae bacterium]